MASITDIARPAFKPQAQAQEPEIIPPRPVGRPSKYEPRFCQAVVDMMGQGFSKTAFAGSIGVSRDTLMNWCREHEEFFSAVKRGETARLQFLEQKLLDGIGTSSNATREIFALKNAAPDEWRDRQEISSDVRVTHEDRVKALKELA